MELNTGRLLIRDFRPEDVCDLHEILADEETMACSEPAYDFEKTKRFLADFCIRRKGAVGVVLRGNHKLIGYLLFNQSGENVYEMGWFFNRQYWRQGYAYEACKALIDHAFDALGAHKVFAETIDATKSVGLMKKLGMRLEGVQRSQTKDNDGNWADLYFYGLLREDR